MGKFTVDLFFLLVFLLLIRSTRKTGIFQRSSNNDVTELMLNAYLSIERLRRPTNITKKREEEKHVIILQHYAYNTQKIHT